jgi:hypothetical protein
MDVKQFNVVEYRSGKLGYIEFPVHKCERMTGIVAEGGNTT